jgi:hypothetical protein
MPLIKCNGQHIDVSKIERIGPIQKTHMGAERWEQAFTVYFHNYSFVVPITTNEYNYGKTYVHTEEEMKILQEKHSKIVGEYEEFHGIVSKESEVLTEERCAVCGRPDVKVYEEGKHLCIDCMQ